jgi:uncharacterized protein (TIGR03067 family)
MRRPSLTLLTFLLVAADPPRPDAVKKDRDKLQGTWALPSRSFPPNPRQGFVLWTFTGDKVTGSVVTLEAKDKTGGKEDQLGKEDFEMGSYAIDPTKNPKTIDLKLTAGPLKGKTLRGIYQFEVNKVELLKLCFPSDPDGTRPAAFIDGQDAKVQSFYRYDYETAKKAVATLNQTLQYNHLPRSAQAKPIDPQATDILRLDLTREGRVPLPGKEPLATLAEIRHHLKDQFTARMNEKGPGQVKTAVVLWPEKDAQVLAFYEVAQAAVAQGFPKVLVQVERMPGEAGRLELVLPHWRRPDSFADTTVLVKTLRDGVNDGNIAALIVQTEAGESAVPDLDALRRSLKQLRDEGKLFNKDSVRIMAEARLQVALLIEVMDACLAAGFPTVIIGPPPDMEIGGHAMARKPAPDAAAQAKAEKDVKAVYEALMAKAPPADLARRLRQAAQVCDDPAARFVLLRESADAAGRAGNIPASLEALDQIADDYRADVWNLKLEKFKNAPASKAIAEAALKQASNASVQGRMDYGIRFLKLADTAAKQMKDKDLIQYVEERRVLFKLPPVDELDPFAPLPASSPRAERPATAKESKAAARSADDEPGSHLEGLLWYVVPAVVVVGLLGGGLVWWMRQGDQAVRSRLAEARKGQFEMPAADEPSETPPAAEQGPPA